MPLLRRLASIARRAESHLANPVVAGVLRSRLHPLLSLRLLLLSYEGRRSGHRYTTPALYRRTGGGVVLFTPVAATNWWWNFRGGHPADVLVRGEWRRGEGEVVSDEDAVVEHLRWTVGPIRRAGAALGHPVPGDARLRNAASSFVLVRVTFDDAPEAAGGGPDDLEDR